VLTGGVIAETEPENRYRLIRNYLNAYDAELQEKNLLTRSAFFEAIFELFETVVRTAIATSKNVKQGAIQKVIQPLARLDYRGSGGRAVLDKKSIVNLMQSTLMTKTQISDEML
jgi:hypothetical protein